jgi:hypothetical protein
MKSLSKLFVVALLLTLISCSSKVQRPQDETTSYSYAGEKYGAVELTVNKEASEDLNDIVRFDDKKLLEMIKKKLDIAGLIDKNKISKVKVEITDIRIRSSFNAFMWGVMAGNDHIRGDVSLLDTDGKIIYKFHVSASYALGGFAGFNETRMGWLFEEFSKLTLEEIAGEQ